MCRKCFNAYEKCARLINDLRNKATKVGEVLGISSACSDDHSSLVIPPPKRVALSAITGSFSSLVPPTPMQTPLSASAGLSSSPDVLVRTYKPLKCKKTVALHNIGASELFKTAQKVCPYSQSQQNGEGSCKGE